MKNRPSCGTRIFDTTLRDGEQMAGVSFSPEQKINLAKKISDFGVDYIDIMPVVSESEAHVARVLSGMNLNSELTASCRMNENDIDLACECGIERITLFTPVSDIHLRCKLNITREENIDRSSRMIDKALERGLRVDFAGEDSTRSDFGYLQDFISSVDERIDTFFVADTLGCLLPSQTYELISRIKDFAKCDIGLHCHNDYGMSTANTLEGLKAGAEVFSGTFTGIGERAGNAPIEEVCVALKFILGKELPVRYEMLKDVCDLVEEYSSVILQKHKPVIGRNAFSHESGIHSDGILKNPNTYENFDPGFVGMKRDFVFGKHTGRNILRYVLEKNSITLNKDELDGLLEDVKKAAELSGLPLYEKDVSDMVKRKYG